MTDSEFDPGVAEDRGDQSGLDALKRALDLTVLRRERAQDLPAVAAAALAAGLDSPSLRRLAELEPSDDPGLIREAFKEAVTELDLPRPAPDEARWRVVRLWATEMLDGARTPIDAARLIWWEGWERLGRPSLLTIFVSLAGEWEEDPESRPVYEQAIRDAARNLLAS